MIQLLILVMLPHSTLSMTEQPLVNFPCLNVTIPQPCNLQVIYPHPIGITTCDGEYRRGGYGSAFDKDPTLKAAVTKQPQRALVVMFDRDASMFHAFYLATVNKSCDVEPIEQNKMFTPPAPPFGTHHYVFFLFDAGNLDNVREQSDMCATVTAFDKRDPIAVTQLRISINDGEGDAAPATSGEPLICPLSPQASTPAQAPAPAPAPQPGSGNSCQTTVGLYVISLLLCLI
ncbi:uncharacterized protein LOC131928697 [Physella acuta]|uniref:uncharacterized protein LOC131928697 n=1 Tax=Physella acuta TaxID=109671 RepID=UPI0027DE1039|nr:uncharacterized protein LOC131928697 [Physella acuta]